jgi:hypothetical protein
VGTTRKEEGNRESEGGLIWWMYFVYVNENKVMKPVEIVLRSQVGRCRG